MKTLSTIFLLLSISVITFAQNIKGLDGFKYQAVIRDDQGGILKIQKVNFKFNILKGSSSGTSAYEETHTVKTNELGLVNLVIGKGAPIQGTFQMIDWGTGSYFIRIEMDETGGNSFELLAITELLSVPYAQYAGNMNYNDTSAQNEIQVLSSKNDTLYLSNGGFVYLGKYNNQADLTRINTRLKQDSILLKDHESKLELRRRTDSAIVHKMLLDSIGMQD